MYQEGWQIGAIHLGRNGVDGLKFADSNHTGREHGGRQSNSTAKMLEEWKRADKMLIIKALYSFQKVRL